MTAAETFDREFTNRQGELATMSGVAGNEGETKMDLVMLEQSIFKYVKIMQDSLA